MDKKLTLYILIGMIAGVFAGFLVYTFIPAGNTHVWPFGVEADLKALYIKFFQMCSGIFLNLVKLLVAPLILSTIIVGIAHMGDGQALGRIGFRAISWFIIASLISIGLGLLMVNLFQPGAGLNLHVGAHSVAEVGEVKKLDFFEFILHIFPHNAFEALSTNNILQILVFALLAGSALSAMGKKGKLLVDGAEALAEMMLQITNYVMRIAPIAVFGALAAVVANKGLGILVTYGQLVLEFYFSLVLLWGILIGFGAIFLGRRILMLIRYVREPVLIAFSTASSEAALPKLFEQLDRFGVPRRISGFMLPMGYSFNLDGSMMYSAYATIFIAQAYNMDLSWTTQILILLTLMISSKGIAAVPRASIVVITATLAMFGLPVEGVALILAIDQFLDMGRTCTNVLGNSVATAVITKWEGMLQDPQPPEQEVPRPPHQSDPDGRDGLNLAPDMVTDLRTNKID